VPCAPEFAEFLERTPEGERSGSVFKLRTRTRQRVSELVSAIGEAAGVMVDQATQKWASAHDYRRAFGTRWAKRVMPAVLKRLMRHKDISTTLKYYVDQEAEDIASDLWAAYRKTQEGTTSGTSGVETAVFPGEER